MKAILKKILAVSLVLLILNFYVPGIARAAQKGLYTAQNTVQITEHSPEVIPIETIAEEKKEGKKTWVWALAGLLLGAVALSGGGGGGGGESPPPPEGDVVVSW